MPKRPQMLLRGLGPGKPPALAAGREHFRNYRDFLARDGLPGLISAHGLSVEIEKVVSAGNMHAYVARK